jgi:hypothetical protein
VPDGRRLWQVNVFCVHIVITCVAGKEEKMGEWGLGKGTKSGAVDSEHGQQGQRFAATYKEPPFQVRGLFIESAMWSSGQR